MEKDVQPIIEVRNISKIFESAWGKVTALRNFSFTCGQGRFVSIVGASGCGKTTLLRIIGGLETVSSGEVFFNGAKVTGPGNDRAFVFQEPRLFPWLNVEHNISFGIQGVKAKKEVQRITEEVLRLVGLTDFRQAFPFELSGGMAQRAAIGRALAFEPEALLLDEPFSALDAQTRARLQIELRDLWQTTGKTILLVTHDIEEALILSQKIIVMSPSPGTVRETLDIGIPYPRNQDDPAIIELKKHIFSAIGGSQS